MCRTKPMCTNVMHEFLHAGSKSLSLEILVKTPYQHSQLGPLHKLGLLTSSKSCGRIKLITTSHVLDHPTTDLPKTSTITLRCVLLPDMFSWGYLIRLFKASLSLDKLRKWWPEIVLGEHWRHAHDLWLTPINW